MNPFSIKKGLPHNKRVRSYIYFKPTPFSKSGLIMSEFLFNEKTANPLICMGLTFFLFIASQIGVELTTYRLGGTVKFQFPLTIGLNDL